MAIATHLIKIKGRFDVQKWTEEKLRKYVNEKISKEIYSFFHAETELFQIQKGSIEVWVYVSALPSEAKLIEKWIDDHIKEDGIEVGKFEVEEIMSKIDPYNQKFSKHHVILH